MKLLVGAATLAKRGNSSEENEDAYAPQVTEAAQSIPFNCAIADGASETLYSGLWAKLLAERFCGVDQPKAFDAEIPALREQWKAATGGKPLAWYTEEKLAKGAFATLLGIRITEGDFPYLRWQAVSVGDSILFHVKACDVLAKFPSMAAEDFKAHPILLSTNAENEPSPELGALYRFTEGVMEAGDRLYLATDKFAEWIIRGLENDTKPFLQIDQIVRMPGSFAGFIESLTQHGDLKNDDYTLLWVEAHSEGV